MIFGKLFGRREDDEEPAAHPPVQRRPVMPRPRQAAAAPTSESGPQPHEETTPKGRSEPMGFDPYNSGVFNKSGAWERINRR